MIGGVFVQARALGANYLELRPAKGGIFTEGILGSFTNVSPLYAASSVDNSVERLVFSGLFKFNQKNQLEGEIASGWTVDERGTTYTVKLRKNVTWHDGKPLTADDVAFTYALIQNPDAKSPLASSWQGITVTAVDPSTVTFKLPSLLSAFPYSMVNGIVPKHILKGVPAAQLRSVSFNTNKPVGSGPFKWEAIEVSGDTPEDRKQRIALIPNDSYVSGAPKLDKYIVRTFQQEKDLIDAFKKRELNAAAGLTSMPEDFKDDLSIRDYNIPLSSQVMVFFKTNGDILKEPKVRQALSYGLDTAQVLNQIGRPVLPSNSPLLRGQVGYDPTVVQRTNNLDIANKLLDEAGWKMGTNNFRYKDKVKLSYILTTQDTSSYKTVADELKKQWAKIGVDVTIAPQKDNELQSLIAQHSYDALLYGISIGPDPDVFAYWHGSQADLRSPNHLNFSKYTSVQADKALEAGRTRSDATARTIKYKSFLEAWINDAPAVSLYQPRYLYVVRDPLFNFNQEVMNNGADRLNNVDNWMIRETNQPKE
jgi:peptide/nickel transport system substrate-binding protein